MTEIVGDSGDYAQILTETDASYSKIASSRNPVHPKQNYFIRNHSGTGIKIHNELSH